MTTIFSRNCWLAAPPPKEVCSALSVEAATSPTLGPEATRLPSEVTQSGRLPGAAAAGRSSQLGVPGWAAAALMTRSWRSVGTSMGERTGCSGSARWRWPLRYVAWELDLVASCFGPGRGSRPVERSQSRMEKESLKPSIQARLLLGSSPLRQPGWGSQEHPGQGLGQPATAQLPAFSPPLAILCRPMVPRRS